MPTDIRIIIIKFELSDLLGSVLVDNSVIAIVLEINEAVLPIVVEFSCDWIEVDMNHVWVEYLVSGV